MKTKPQLKARPNTGPVLMLALLAALTGAGPALAQTNTPAARTARTETSTSLSYESFRLVNDRNIFDGNRSGQNVRSSSRNTSRSRSAQVESFNLVGTLVADGKAMAFFDGTDSSYRKTLAAGSRISAFQVVEIQPAGIRLTEGTNTIDLKVGAGFSRENRGPWKTTGIGTKYVGSTSDRGSREEFASNRPPTPNQENDSAESSREADSSEPEAASSSSMEENDILKKLMEKRKSE